jgi:hypothetical protein
MIGEEKVVILRTDVPSEMPLRGREEDESALFAQQYPFRATFEGSLPA